MKYIKHDIEMSSTQKMMGKVVLKIYTYNVRLPVGQRIANWYHDAFSKFYDRLVPFGLPKYHEIVDMLVKEYIPKDSMVLDLCCGTGNIALAAASKAEEVIGLDASEGMLAKARNKAHAKGIGNVKFVLADVTEGLDFGDGSFDVVTAGWSVPTKVPLFQDKNMDIMRETYRVLRKGGKLVLWEGLNEITNIYLSEVEYDELLSGAGYNDVEVKNINDLYAVVSAKK